MGDNAIIFSYDTRVNAHVFCGVIGVCFFVFLVFYIFRHHKKPSVELKWLMLTEYMVALLLLTVVFRETPVFPDDFQNSFFANKRELTGSLITEWVVNLLMFIPIGWLLSSMISKNRFVKILLIGLALSLSIETLQFLFNKGVADIEDMVCNTFGLISGYSLWFLTSAARNRCTKSI